MGQLEKYGLYVLCLVIFLILGVAIWGGDPATLPPPGKDVPKLAAELGKGREAPKDQTRESKEPVKDPAHQVKDAGKEPSKGTGEDIGSLLVPTPKGVDKDAKKEPAKDAPAPKPNGETSAAKTPEGGKTPSQPAAEPKTRLYVVKDHDSLYRIAERELGSAARLNEIEALNPTIKRGAIKKGDQIKLPTAKAHDATPAVAKHGAADKTGDKVADKAGSKPKPAPGSTYKVQHGDTLTSISRAAYGNENHVRAILAANVGKVASANSIKENMVLSLPAKPGS